MRTSKEELISNELKPIICQKIKDARIKFGYSLEDLAKALNYQKNRQTLHKYENGTLNIPYNILFEICRIFNIEDIDISNIEKIVETYKNAIYEPITNASDLTIKVIDDSMEPAYLKNDKVNIVKLDSYKNGDDIVIAIKNNILAVRRLYKYPKGIILQALNPKYQTININIVSNDMILGKVVSLKREIK